MYQLLPSGVGRVHPLALLRRRFGGPLHFAGNLWHLSLLFFIAGTRHQRPNCEAAHASKTLPADYSTSGPFKP